MENKEYVDYYFKVSVNCPEKWICRCGKKLKKASNTGYSNLMVHVRTQHKNYVEDYDKVRKGSQLQHFGFVPCDSAIKVLWLVRFNHFRRV